MSRVLMSVQVQGKTGQWGFEFYGDERHLAEWRADGLDVIVIENIIPAWVADAGLARAWCAIQDMLNFKNPSGR